MFHSHEPGFTDVLPAVWTEVVRVARHMRQQHAQPARHERPHAMRPPPRLPARPITHVVRHLRLQDREHLGLAKEQ